MFRGCLVEFVLLSKLSLLAQYSKQHATANTHGKTAKDKARAEGLRRQHQNMQPRKASMYKHAIDNEINTKSQGNHVELTK